MILGTYRVSTRYREGQHHSKVHFLSTNLSTNDVLSGYDTVGGLCADLNQTVRFSMSAFTGKHSRKKCLRKNRLLVKKALIAAALAATTSAQAADYYDVVDLGV